MPSFTRKAIKESFLKLLNERPMKQITVKDIVEDCGINRNSFYYHFADIPSLLEEIIVEEADRIIKEYPSIDSFEKCIDIAIQFALQNRRAVLHIYNSVSRDLYEQYLLRVCRYVVSTYFNTVAAGMNTVQSDMELMIRFYQCELFGQIIVWMNEGMKEEIREQFLRLCELRKGMAEAWLRRNAETKGGC